MTTGNREPQYDTILRQNKRLFVLSAAADAIHRAETEAAVFETFAAQIAELDFYGGLMLFSSAHPDRILVKGMAVPPEMKPFADSFPDEFYIPLSPAQMFGAPERYKEARFIADNTPMAMAVLRAVNYPNPEAALEITGKSIIRTPLIIQGEVAGMLLVLGRNITVEDVPLAATLANHVAAALEKMRLVSTARRQAQELSAVYDAVLALGEILDTRQALHRLYELVSAVITLDAFGVFLHKSGGDEFYIAMAVEDGVLLTDVLGTTFKVDEESGFTGYVMRTQRPFLVRDVEKDDLPINPIQIGGDITHSWAGVPLMIHHRTVGVLSVQGKKPNMFTRQDLRFLETLATGVAIALENARLFEQARLEIAERKQTEAALAKSEAFNRRLMDGAPIGILYLDGDGTIVYGNPALRNILGMPANEYFPLRNMHVQDLPLAQTAPIETALHCVLSGEMLNGEIIHIHSKWRKQLELEIFGAPLFSANNKLDGAVLMVHDLTQHRRAERTRDAAYRITEAAYRAENMPELFAIIHEIVRNLIGVDNFYIALFDEEQNLLTFPYVVDEMDEVAPHAPGKSLTAYVLRTGKPLLGTPEVLDELTASGALEIVGTRPVDWLGIPLNVEDKTIGVLTVQSYDPAVRLDERHEQMLVFVSTQVAMAIERKQAEENIRQRNRELAILNKIINATAVAVDEQTVLQIACQELLDVFDMARAVATVISPGTRSAKVVAEARRPGVPAAIREPIPLPENRELYAMLAQRAPFVVSDIDAEPRVQGVRHLVPEDTKSIVFLPLFVDDSLVAVLSMISPERRHFTTPEVNFAWSFADQISTGITRVRLQESQRMLSAAIEQAAEGVMITDHRGHVVYINPALEQISGISHRDVAGLSAVKLIRRSMPAATLMDILRALRDGKSWSGRVTARKPDGSKFTVELTTAPVRDMYHNTVNFVGVMHDITAQLQLEAQYRQAQKMDAIGQLTGGIAHDFNNILTAVNGFAELLQRRLNEDDPRRRLADKILDSGKRASALVRKLLTFSRKQIVETQPLNLNTVVEHMKQMLQPIIGENVRINMMLSPDLWLIDADPTQIEQIIINLAVNARDAMPGGGKIIIETANVVLDETFTGEHFGVEVGRYVRLNISDTGVGMTADVRERIFEPFFSTKEKGKGTGLGLATVFGIVKQNGGSIWVYSEKGQGTTFKIYLPASEVEKKRLLASGAETLALARGNETILVVEDDADVRDLATQILEMQGYTVLTAESGEDALKIVSDRQHAINLVLTDVVMPGINGKELMEALADETPALKVMFMSGYTNDLIATKGILSDDIVLITKPFTAETLTRAVRMVLDA